MAPAIQPPAGWQPVAAGERYRTLDAIRGVSLFGVVLVNLLMMFRVPLSEHILKFHTHTGWANHAVDVAVTWLVEFKAFALFSLMFGAGVAIQAERATRRATLSRSAGARPGHSSCRCWWIPCPVRRV